MSIVIVNWNTKDLLLSCLDSIKSNGGVIAREAIVVDNGSTDGSASAARKAHPGTIVVENASNSGFAHANNQGIRRSAGAYVCLVNSDVELLPNCLVKLVTFMEANPDVGVAGPRVLNPDLTLQNSCRKFPSLWNILCPALGLDKVFRRSSIFSGEHMSYFSHDVRKHVDYLAGCFLMVRRDALEQVGPLDERYFMYQEEVDWCQRFHRKGWKVAFFPDARVVHHHAASSSKDPVRFTVARQKSLLQYWRNYHGVVSGWALRLILMGKSALRVVPRSVLYLLRPSQRSRLGTKLRSDLACFVALLRRVA